MGKRVFVTVGSTSFDALAVAALSEPSLSELKAQGYSSITLQHGRSGHSLPQAPHVEALEVRTFEYSPSLSEEMGQADLIISHAGAGSILESLKLHKNLIVVANETLMDNHQLELAQKLSRDGYCISATPSTLCDVIKKAENATLKRIPESNGNALATIIKEELTHL